MKSMYIYVLFYKYVNITVCIYKKQKIEIKPHTCTNIYTYYTKKCSCNSHWNTNNNKIKNI